MEVPNDNLTYTRAICTDCLQIVKVGKMKTEKVYIAGIPTFRAVIKINDTAPHTTIKVESWSKKHCIETAKKLLKLLTWTN